MGPSDVWRVELQPEQRAASSPSAEGDSLGLTGDPYLRDPHLSTRGRRFTFQRLFNSDALLLAELGRDPRRPPIFPAPRAGGSGQGSEKEKERSCPGGQANKWLSHVSPKAPPVRLEFGPKRLKPDSLLTNHRLSWIAADQPIERPALAILPSRQGSGQASSCSSWPLLYESQGVCVRVNSVGYGFSFIVNCNSVC